MGLFKINRNKINYNVMKTPTLKQVQEHFKYANVIMVNGINHPFYGSDLYFKFLDSEWICNADGHILLVWDKEKGYAKITHYQPNDKSNEIGIPIMKTILDKLANTQRPIINHKHTQGEWRIINAAMTTCVESGDKSICTLTSGLSEINKHNAKLIRIAPQLLQIAEMYFDSMKGTDAEGSIPFNLTLETLNKLK